jgi:hypothetical protein
MSGIDKSAIASECFARPDAPAHREGRKARTRTAIVLACRSFMQAGQFLPPLQACCDRAGRSSRAGYRAFGSVEALRLEAADDPPTRQAIVERVLGCECCALSAETLDRLVRTLVTGAG